MAWHRITHRTTGEVQIVASLDGLDPDQWDAVPIKANRAPTEFQTVLPDGTLRTDRAAEDRAARRSARFAGKSPDEIAAEFDEWWDRLEEIDSLLAMIEALEARVRKLEP